MISLNIQTVIAVYENSYTWRLNTNLLETNLINITLLVTGLIYVLKQFLGQALSSRQEKVLASIQEAENQLTQAKNRLLESEKQFAQSKMIIEQIQKEARITAKKVKQSILNQGKLDVERLVNTGKASIITAENQIRKQIQEQITALAIKRVFLGLKKEISKDMQTTLLNRSISQLDGKL